MKDNGAGAKRDVPVPVTQIRILIQILKKKFEYSSKTNCFGSTTLPVYLRSSFLYFIHIFTLSALPHALYDHNIYIFLF
jgi:hypothetical protein